jgi:ATP-dependent HslUV protease ATP-binding subunit HslU
VREIARFAAVVNDKTENIGARRLHTILERLLDELSFDASERGGETVVIDSAYVGRVLEGIVRDEDLSRYVL